MKTDGTSSPLCFYQRKTMTRSRHDQNGRTQPIDCTAISLCLIGGESKGLTKFQTKPAPEDE